jgi:hypothetical protein
VSVRAVIAALLSAAACGCSGSPTQPSWDGRVRVAGAVRDFATSGTVSAAAVVFGNSGAGDLSATTDGRGAYSLTASQGMYHVTINGESIADVTLRDPTYRGDFFVRVTNCVGRYGMILDSRTRQPVSGATVSLGPDPLATTDQTGWYQYQSSVGCSGLCGFNTYFVLANHPRYAQKIMESSRGFCGVRRLDVELDPG